jgi:hydrogenase 3 maturation protease
MDKRGLGDETLALREEIAAWLESYERLAVMGIGNPLRGDDAIGVEVLRRLKGRIPENVALFECEMVPENFLSEIEGFKPTHVLMIDAAQLEVEPGEASLIQPEKITGQAFSTHTIPLSLTAGILQGSLGAKIILLGVKPETTEFGEGLSPKLQKASKEIAQIIAEAIRQVS